MSLPQDSKQQPRKNTKPPHPVEAAAGDPARDGVLARIEDATLAILQKHGKKSA